MDSLLQDLRYAVRSLLRTPGVTFTAVVVLALGIGANTALFSLFNGVFLQPPPGVREADGLHWVNYVSHEYGAGQPIGLDYPMFAELRERTDLFSDLAVFATTPVDFAAGDRPERVTAEVVSGGYFSTLRMRLSLGRGFLAEEDRTPGTHPVVVLGHDLWQNRFGGAPDVVGRQVVINGSPFTVVGVTPAGFRGLRNMERPADLWVPVMMYPVVMPGREDPLGVVYGVRNFSAVGRLLPGVPVERVTGSMEAFILGMAADHPLAYDEVGAALYRFHGIAGPLRWAGEVFVALFAGALTLIVLLIACANVANLLLARAATRRREIAIRAAIGASRGRVVKQLVVESTVLAIAGGAAAVIVASWMLDLFTTLAPIDFPLPVALDGRTLLVTLAIALGTGVLVGLSPALRSSRTDLVEDLKGSRGRGVVGGGPRSTLVTSQLALSCMLLVGAALVVRAMWEIVAADRRQPARDEVIALTLDPRTQGYTDTTAAVLKELLLERATATPGVHSVSIGGSLPYDWASLHAFRFTLESQGPPAGEGTTARTPLLRVVRPDFFRTVELPLLRGRDFTDRDSKESPPVAIVNETAAARYWPDEDPLGQRLRTGADTLPWTTVVGMVADARYDLGPEGDPEPAVYLSELQRGPLGSEITLLARTGGDATTLAAPLRDVVRAIDPDLAIYRVRTLGQMLDERWAEGRLAGMLLVSIGALALALALIGLHGVVAYSVEQRTREVGIRMSLGASRPQILRLFSKDVLRVAGMGVGVGLLLSAGMAALLGSMIAELEPLDAAVFTAVAALLLLVALAASYLPARRATRVDPMVALRAE